MSDTPDLDGATTYRETARPDSTEWWHVLADGVTVVYERRPGEFEPARVLDRGDVGSAGGVDGGGEVGDVVPLWWDDPG
jgi:hypothetical protein